MSKKLQTFSKKDYSSGSDVKWCAGCGDFAILAQVQKVLAEIGRPPEEYAFISGIGCSSRFPYYMGTYGYHTIHGRALAIATGAKTFNPDLSVWVTMGDGDSISIGGNHFIHTIRKNLDIVCIVIDNQIYGLTKGQFSPTSTQGQVTKTSPSGKRSLPMDPVALALGAGVNFVARATDRKPKQLAEVLHKAYQHKGFSLVHVLQNCVIFNNGAYDDITNKMTRDDHSLVLKDGEPMIFGKNKDKAIVLEGLNPKVANRNFVDESKILIHHEEAKEPGLALLLSSMRSGKFSGTKTLDKFPIPLGVLRNVEEETYDDITAKQVERSIARNGKGDLQKMLNAGDTWEIN
jgi:2-oxoglutarate/2-oxoacid ferredoxin oxidoreductase subunit beta